MIKNNQKELQESLHRADVRLAMSMADLQLKYLFHVIEAGMESDFSKAIAGYTSIITRMKNIPGFSEDHEDWQDALMSLKDIYSRCSADGDRNAFASAPMKILAPFISSSCTMATPDASLRWFGCFRYNYVPETKQIYLHFKNACCPESPFASMSDRFAELLLIADDIEKKGFAPLLIGCDSWLNELNSFKELFPLEYSKSFIISPPDSKGGYGWWGQFIDKNGKFSTKKAEKFEGKMEFQFRRIIAKCSYESFLCHIRSKIKDIDPDQHYCHR